MSNLKELKVFIVDDEIYYLNILAQHIQNLGCHEVTLFTNGADCLAELPERPDVIFLDYRMDTLSGFDVLKSIKRYDSDIFIVIISGQSDIKVAVDSLKYGAFEYIKKGDMVGDMIENVLERILEVKSLLNQAKPNLLRKLFQFF